ncbi:SusD/RagB family nutrient-binding outer membrane lipoprotein [Zhouia amylolytica]|uniref:SusD/RagB family nutrient-binding outer membrane lipoprotein n=1 Tax=Zhouia amylolytica AD3 TaxID=1286632 RepID=W2URT4_9FLAO|nr:SusD/RagB family nutrient-binding outer membrane lipoprotein [Zhouia amylolytica]ETN96728.1 hypothetical protein P278_01540 [Zhouia amylolytica AD3]
MKTLLKILFFFVLVVSCKDELDINTNPNTPAEVDKRYILTAAEGSLATIMGGDLTNLGGFFAQYHTQAPSASQYLNIDTYNINTDYANRLWSELYAGCLNDLNYVINASREEGETGSVLIATVLRAYTFQVLTDLFGDVPYTEALQGNDNITPSPDAGESIYQSLISEINSAKSNYLNNPVESTVGQQDAIYEADMDSWIQFANTLLLKLHLRMAYTSSANPSAVNSLLADDNFLTSDAMFAAYDGEINKSHPFYDVQIDRLGDVNNVASNSLMQFYLIHSDPRISSVYRLNNGAAFRGLDQGDRESFVNDQAQDFSRPNIEPQTPVYFMTVAESNFLQAEALIRYSGGSGADAKYNTGIEMSFMTYGLSPADAQPFIAAGGDYEYVASGDIETAVRQVMVQKWASLAYINNIEAFFEVKRTKYPETVAPGAQDYSIGNLISSINSILPGTQTPNSMFYPDSEVTRNPNLVQKSSLLEKAWWDQKQE